MLANPRVIRLGVQILLGVWLAHPLTGVVAQAEPECETRPIAETVKLLRVRRLATTWTDAEIDVMTRSGSLLSGRFLSVDHATLLLSSPEGPAQPVPVRDVVRVIIKRQPSDLVFMAALALGMGGLLAGVGTLGLDADRAAAGALASGGVLLGATIGWKTVYRERVMTFE